MGLENGPKQNGPKDIYNSEERRKLFGDAKDALRKVERGRLSRTIINATFRTVLYAAMIATPEGREVLADPERRRALFDREKRTGLLEDSIISDELFVPNSEGTSLERMSAVAGRFVGYDFHRPEEFKGVAKHRDRQRRQDARLWVFNIDEIQGRDSSAYTPTDLFNLFSLSHFLSLDIPTVEEAVENGFLKEGTYKSAYEKVGLDSKYGRYLALQGLLDKPVYVVTPKGNGLVFLMKDAGDKKKQEDAVGEAKPSLLFPAF